MNYCYGVPGLGGLLCRLSALLNYLLPVLIALGVVYLVWGIVQYVIGSSEEAKSKGKNTIIFGIIGLVVIVSLWGLVYLVVNTFNLNNGDNYAPTSDDLNNLLPRGNFPSSSQPSVPGTIPI